MPDQECVGRTEGRLSTRLRIAATLGALVSFPPTPVRSQGATPPVATDGQWAGTIDIGGRSLYIDRRGSGGPTVILESGAGNAGQIWDTIAEPAGPAVLPGVASFARVCAYDRPGTYTNPGVPGRSDDVAMPRTAGDIVADLRALLVASGVPGPYVMVGHSFGGLIVRLYASTFPDDVLGLVLVDAAHENYYEEIQQLLTPAQWDSWADPAPDPDYPNLERIDTDASAVEMREAALASPLRPMPMVVITHGQPWAWPDGYPVSELEALWLPLQERLASLVPDARLVIAEGSGHFIQLDQPELVIEGIRQVVEAVRQPTAW